MNFESLRMTTIGEGLTAIAQEGGATVGGLFTGGFIGRRVENALMGTTPVTPESSLTDKGKAWIANNGPKMLLWWYLRGRVAPGTILDNFRQGVVTSAALDTFARLTTGGVGVPLTIAGFDVMSGRPATEVGNETIQRLQAEVQQLRTQMAQMQLPFGGQYPPYTHAHAGGIETQAAPFGIVPPGVRNREFGAMRPWSAYQLQEKFRTMERTTPGAAETKRKYGSMYPPDVGMPAMAGIESHAGTNMKGAQVSAKSIAAMFGLR